MRMVSFWVALFVVLGAVGIRSEDWPEFRGAGRVGVWAEDGIVDRLPAELMVRWRTPVRAGYSGPSVANGRVFLTDYQITKRPLATERLLVLDEETGAVLWTYEWEVSYASLQDTTLGPRANPVVDGDRVYVVGTTGVLHAFNVKTGEVLWGKDYVKDYDIELSQFGVRSEPVVEGDVLIALVGGTALDTWQPPVSESAPDAREVPVGKVIAFDKVTGEEVWRALPANSEAGLSQPIIITAGGTRQLIIWTPQALSSLDPRTGKVYWEHPFRARHGSSIGTPVFDGQHLLISSFWNSSMLLTLDDKTPAATILWKGKGETDILTDTLHAFMMTPVIRGEQVYGICSFGQLRALDVETGERLWESQEVTKERRRYTTAFFVRHKDRFFITNDRGELIIARLSAAGYEEISRVSLLKPTSPAPAGTRRELKAVSWAHPAYANKNIYHRNDEEIVSVSLAADDYK